MTTQPHAKRAAPQGKIVQLVTLPDTPNTRRLAQVCYEISRRTQPTKKAA